MFILVNYKRTHIENLAEIKKVRIEGLDVDGFPSLKSYISHAEYKGIVLNKIDLSYLSRKTNFLEYYLKSKGFLINTLFSEDDLTEYKIYTFILERLHKELYIYLLFRNKENINFLTVKNNCNKRTINRYNKIKKTILSVSEHFPNKYLFAKVFSEKYKSLSSQQVYYIIKSK